MHNFRVAESDAFLSASLSLSFGVMVSPRNRNSMSSDLTMIVILVSVLDAAPIEEVSPRWWLLA